VAVWGEEEKKGEEMSRAGGKWREGLAFIDESQTGLDRDERLQRHRKCGLEAVRRHLLKKEKRDEIK